MVIYIQLSWPFNILMQNRIEFTQFIEKINIDIKFFIKLVYFALIYFINQFNDYCIGALVLIQNFWDSLKQSICKPRHWNLAIGIGIGNGIGIGTDITNAIISSSMKPIDPKVSRVVTQEERTPPTKSRDTLISWSRDKQKTLYLHFHNVYGSLTQQGSDLG